MTLKFKHTSMSSHPADHGSGSRHIAVSMLKGVSIRAPIHALRANLCKSQRMLSVARLYTRYHFSDTPQTHYPFQGRNITLIQWHGNVNISSLNNINILRSVDTTAPHAHIHHPGGCKYFYTSRSDDHVRLSTFGKQDTRTSVYVHRKSPDRLEWCFRDPGELSEP
jgi:hypothetical protein